MMRGVVVAALLPIAACAVRDRAQDSPPRAPASTSSGEAAPGWQLSGSGSYYALAGENDYFVPVVTADREALHLEARWQYEDLETASAWAGWNFGLGEELRFEGTLMGGIVGGNTQGVAPGYRFELSYGIVDLFSEGEYLISTEDHAENFFYSWSELGVTPVDWLRVGLVGQRTKVIENEPIVDRGVFVRIDVRGVTLSVYGFNLDDDERYFVFAVATEF